VERLPKLRIQRGYWICNPTVEGKRRCWSLGRVDQVSEVEAKQELRERLNLLPGASSSNSQNVDEAIASFLEDAEKIYRRNDGTPTGEADNLLYGLQPFSDLFGALKVSAVVPAHFKIFGKAQMQADVSRQTINKRIGQIKRFLLWCKNEGYGNSYDACRDVQGMRAGRGAREAKAIHAVPWATVEQTLPHLPPTVQAMIRVQHAAAMRPEEICSIRLCDLEMKGEVWLYVPPWHKNEHRGRQRRIHLGPDAQIHLKPYITPSNPRAPLFSPAQAVAERRGKLPKKRIGASYDTRSYRRAIWYACSKAFPVPEHCDNVQAWLKANRWSPNRLRKTKLDEIASKHGKQAAKAYAGHSRVEVTQDHYLSQDDTLAISVAKMVG
jgi:integrase